jgi:hypothetical protein
MSSDDYRCIHMICVGLRSEFAIDCKIVQCWRRPVASAITSHLLTLSRFYGAADENLDLHTTLSLRHRNSTLACTASW